MREGEIDEMDAKEQQKTNWQAVLGRQPYPPQAGVTLASPTHPQFRVSNRSALPGFPAAAPESRACQRESGSSQRSIGTPLCTRLPAARSARSDRKAAPPSRAQE